MAVEDIDILQAHARQRLVEAGQQVLAGTPFPVRPWPHVVARLGRDDQLVAIAAQVRAQDRAEVGLGGAIRRAIVVGQIKVRYPEVERAPDDRALQAGGPVITEVLPEPERNLGKLQPAAPAPPVRDLLIAAGCRDVGHTGSLPPQSQADPAGPLTTQSRDATGRRITGLRSG